MTARYAEDLAPGETIAFGSYTVTRAEIVAFAEQWDPQSFHVDAEAAARGRFGDVIASGLHTLGVFQRLSVLSAESQWAVIAGVRLVDVRFPRPVRPGVTLTGGVRIESVDVDPSRRRALLVKAGWLDDEEGRVLELRSEALVRCRP
ncbi:MaoC/PaaZ C-terminal domain-containing protein [Dactylosporangium salmoneum]|uniref:MaoC family dehydratase n=1 Tax=Dactylosporangium salmoneum TaxID=53361 RepID=A0ABP5U0G1_9ACTN